jgi:hypothetical protein
LEREAGVEVHVTSSFPLFLRLCSLLRDVILKIKDRIDKTALLFDESELDVVLAPPFS